MFQRFFSGFAKLSDLENQKFTREQVLDSLAGMFNSHRKRTIRAVSKLTNWPENEVFLLVSERSDYYVSRGVRSGKLYVSQV